MVVTAELPLICAAAALALVALSLFLAPQSRAARRIAVVFAVAGTVTPLLLATLLDPTRAAGRALWEWSAAGGPTIQASYRFDGIAAVAVAVGAAHGGGRPFVGPPAAGTQPLPPPAGPGLCGRLLLAPVSHGPLHRTGVLIASVRS